MQRMRCVSVLMHGSLFSSGGIVGSEYIMESKRKYIMMWVSSEIVLYGASFMVHSSSGTVRMVIVSWSSCTARRAQCMAFCVFSLLSGWVYPLSFHLCEKAMPLDPNIESLWNGE